MFNFWQVSLFLTLLLYGLLYNWKVLLVWLAVTGTYLLLATLLGKNADNDPNTVFRINSWFPTREPNLRQTIAIDVTRVDQFLKEYKENNPDKRLTYTHLCLKSLGLGLKDSGSNFKIIFGE